MSYPEIAPNVPAPHTGYYDVAERTTDGELFTAAWGIRYLMAGDPFRTHDGPCCVSCEEEYDGAPVIDDACCCRGANAPLPVDGEPT